MPSSTDKSVESLEIASEVSSAPSHNSRVGSALSEHRQPDLELVSEDELEILPSVPDDVTPEAVHEWICTVIPMMEPDSKLRERLTNAVRRYDFILQKSRAKST